jgi:serine/threonine-protein kinase PknG
VIDDQGFCTECDRRPMAAAPAAPAAHSGGPAGPSGASVGAANLRPDPWWGLDLVVTDHVPDIPDEPPGQPLPAGPVPEERRFCANSACAEPVGRGHDGEPGRTAGFCAACGARFDFTRPSGPDTVAGRYVIERRLGAGSFGEASLAHDRNLETRVVLKALKKESVAKTAKQERDALVGLRHDSIVRILDYESEGPHLVLEYVPGAPLSARADDGLDVLLAHGVRILQALDYLHARGLLHCDVKPSNIIRFREDSAVGPRDRVRLIDFGSVRTVGDTAPVVAYTKAYAPPADGPNGPDREHLHPTAGFDLFCLGMTLAEICRPHLRDRTAPGVDSLQLLLDRATDVHAAKRRFVSARQFAEQLSGVIRQVVATAPAGQAGRPTQGRRVTRPSALFGSMTEALHGGLGAARPFEDWVGAGLTPQGLLTLPAPFSSPLPQDIAAALPTPLSDPDEPALPQRTETALAECRLALRRKDVALAEQALAGAELVRQASAGAPLAELAAAHAEPPPHWLYFWYRGLVALGQENVAGASGWFTSVRRALPGELIPQLALGLCAELRGDLPVAQSHYATVFGTAPALGAAGFGLARVHLLAGRRAEAVATAEQLAQEFRFEREARVAAVRLLTALFAAPAPGPGTPTADDLARARTAAAGLDVGDAAATGLRAEIAYAEFGLARDRLELSHVIREVAAHAATEREHTALVDLANRLRPELTWPWRSRRSGGADRTGTAGRTAAGGARRTGRSGRTHAG